MSTKIKSIDRAAQVECAYVDACTDWVGCDWVIEFGPYRLNLQNMTSTQCQLMARATAGKEADGWWDAAQWLSRIEQEASEARKEGQAAVAAVQAGDWIAALAHARHSCDIEARYHTHLVWQPLRDAVEAGLKRSNN